MASRHQEARPLKRYGYWYLVRRVPRRFSAHDRRNPVMLSIGLRIADDPRAMVAGTAVQKLDQGLERYWRDLSSGHDNHATARHEQSLETARRVSIPYVPASRIATSPLEQIAQRAELIESSDAVEKPIEVSAILGGQDVPPLKLSQMMANHLPIAQAHLSAATGSAVQRWQCQSDGATADGALVAANVQCRRR